MDATFGAHRQRRKSRLGADLIGDELVDGDVAVRPLFGFVVQHAGEKRVDREMPATESVIEPAIDRDLVAVCGQRFQQRRFLKRFSRRFGKKLLLLKAEKISHRDKPAGPRTGTTGGSDGGTFASRLCH